MSSSRAQRAALFAPLNARIAVSSSCLSITQRLRRFTERQEWDVGSGDHVVTPLANQIARAHFAGDRGGAHGRKPASRFPGTPVGGALCRAGTLSCHQPKGSS
jgi:hypothetical protein